MKKLSFRTWIIVEAYLNEGLDDGEGKELPWGRWTLGEEMLTAVAALSAIKPLISPAHEEQFSSTLDYYAQNPNPFESFTLRTPGPAELALLAACEAIEEALAKGELKFTHKRRSDSEPYHPANVALHKALQQARDAT